MNPPTLAPEARTEAQRILDRAARRILAERLGAPQRTAGDVEAGRAA